MSDANITVWGHPTTLNMQQNSKKPLMAIVEMDLRDLAKLIQLPDGARINDVRLPLGLPGIIHFRVIDAGWPCGWGEFIHRSNPTIAMVEGQPLVDYGFPKNPG